LQNSGRIDSEEKPRSKRQCHSEIRLRAIAIFQNSKTPMLILLRAICLVIQGKRGVSALELQADLGMKSYGTVWIILHKIREALRLTTKLWSQTKRCWIIGCHGFIYFSCKAYNVTGTLRIGIGNRSKVEVTAKNMDQAPRYPGQEKAVIEFSQKNTNAQQSLRAPIFEDKTIQLIIAQGNVKDKKVTQTERVMVESCVRHQAAIITL
jgi:hypothetical protein